MIFYNTEHSPDGGLSSDLNLVLPKKSAVFIPLDIQKVENIERVMEFQKSDDFDDFPTKYGHSEDCNLSDIFWFCSKLFTRCGYQMRATSIVLFTDNPLPHPKDSHEYRQLVLKANDLQQAEVLVSLMPMSTDFDCNLFYRQFLCVVLDEDYDHFQAPTYEGNIAQLTKRIYRRDFRKKANSKVVFQIGDEYKFGVALYSMARWVNKPSKLLMDRDTDELIIKKRVYVQMSEEGGTKVMGPGDQRKSIEFAGEKIFFTTDEHSRMHSVVPKGLKLLGFKPIDTIQPEYFLNPCLFMFPNEEQFVGSTNVFAALWSRCLARGQAMIAVMVQRYKSTPMYVALVPQENDDLRKNGFRVIFLPYKDDQRSLDVYTKEAPPVVEDDKEVLRKMIKRIKFKFNPSYFENPDLKQFYNNIESIVYKAEEVTLKDQTIPVLDDRASNACKDVIEHFGEVSLDAPKAKRAATVSQAAPKLPKIPKLTQNGDLEIEILSALKAGKVCRRVIFEHDNHSM